MSSTYIKIYKKMIDFPRIEPRSLASQQIEFLTKSISSRSGISDRFKGELPVWGFVGIEYLLWFTGSSKGQSSQIILSISFELQ